MFIHWGPYSLKGVEASWPIMRPKGGPEWGKLVSEPEYRELPKRFNPVRFDPADWVHLAKQAGMRYMVFTSKHHDGFCMFDSSYTDYKITKTPYGKDTLAALSDACTREGMPLGLYYSPPDLNHPGYRDTTKPSSLNWNGEPTRPDWPLYLDYMEMQLRELLTRYGDVALIWFDGLRNQKKYDGLRFHKLIHDLQPATLINDRIGLQGDYATPEQFIPAAIPTKSSGLHGTIDSSVIKASNNVPAAEDFQLWETCMTINGTWAHNPRDIEYKSTTQLIQALVETASRGGNFLLNVGPTPEGTIQPEFQERLQGIGKWIETNGEAIYGSTFGPLQGLPFGRTTAKGNTVYVHVYEWPQGGKLTVEGLVGKVSRVTQLSGAKRLSHRQSGRRLTIDGPAEAPDPHVSVLAIELRQP